MQPKDIFDTLKAGIRFTAFWLIVSVSACTPAPPPVIALQPQIPADPMIAFVSSGRIGQIESVTEPSYGGIVNVAIETQYNSAGGQICRTYTVTNATRQIQQLACNDGAHWQVMPPLMNSNN